jgi:energy-converting hydrogenase Eha subunit A
MVEWTDQADDAHPREIEEGEVDYPSVRQNRTTHPAVQAIAATVRSSREGSQPATSREEKDTMGITNLLRGIHVLAGTAWLGEVLVVNVVLIPVLTRLEPEKRGWFLSAIFPRVFQLASILSLTTILAGAALNLSLSDWRVDVAASRLIASRWGWCIMLGGVLGFGLTLFHFVAERRLEPHVVVDDDPDGTVWARTQRHLTIIPRVGSGVLLVIVVLMMVAARGL